MLHFVTYLFLFRQISIPVSSHIYSCFHTQVYCVFTHIETYLSGWMFGDPHIRTTDGKSYTYNGLGEFWLQRPTKTPEDDFFRLQGRTDIAWDSQGQPQQATVFVAFAAKDKGTGRIHVGLNEDRNGSLCHFPFSVHSSVNFIFRYIYYIVKDILPFASFISSSIST